VAAHFGDLFAADGGAAREAWAEPGDAFTVKTGSLFCGGRGSLYAACRFAYLSWTEVAVKGLAVVFLAALMLGGCSDSPSAGHTAVVAVSSTMPPRQVADCPFYTLLDDKCTRDWYTCTSNIGEHPSCTKAWAQCCTLQGKGARTALESQQP